MSTGRGLSALLGTLLLITTGSVAGAQTTSEAAETASSESVQEAASFAADNNRLDGDHLKLKVNVDGFSKVGSAGDEKFCAPKGSKLKVSSQTDSELLVYFKTVPDAANAKPRNTLASTGEAATTNAVSDCKKPVNDFTQYKIPTSTLQEYAFRRTGVMFGALVVPFKFYLGDDSKLSASSTIAPYIGFRAASPFGLNFTPVVSAGLGLVPVSDAASGETSTKASLSTAFGVLLTHTKNEQFNAGVLFGKDFLSKSDRGTDETVDNLWFSIYAGYAL